MHEDKPVEIDREKLLAAAREAMEHAYAPYSGFRVGAALITPAGNVYSGCNVENASYGLTVCAERNAVFRMVASGERRITALLITGETDTPFPPCGACLQVISEFADEGAHIWLAGRKGGIETFRFDELLPKAFVLKKER